MKVSLHTAHAFLTFNSVIKVRLDLKAAVSLYACFFAVFLFSFFLMKYSLSVYGFMSNFNLSCLTMGISVGLISVFVPSEKIQSLDSFLFQYLSFIPVSYT